jgi:hypothetical protein
MFAHLVTCLVGLGWIWEGYRGVEQPVGGLQLLVEMRVLSIDCLHNVVQIMDVICARVQEFVTKMVI